MKLTINQTYQNLIPALKEDEFKQLEENILKEGIREKLTVWNNTIIDGHNRYAIATKHNIPFEIHEKQFESENDAKLWMIDNQKGRRNLTDWVKHELAQVKREILKEIGMKKKAEIGRDSGILGGRGNKTLLPIMGKRVLKQNHNTQNQIAEDLGWSKSKVSRADVVRKHIDHTGNEALREKLRNNEISINQAYQQIKQKKDELKSSQSLNLQTEAEQKSYYNAQSEKDLLRKAKELKEQRKQDYKEKLNKRIEEKAKQPISEEEQTILNRLKKGETVVINMNKHFAVLQYAKENNLYQQIDRYSEWGNPFTLDLDGDRDHVCDAYERYYMDKKSLHPKIKNLKGKALGCHCHPLRCHGDHLKKVADDS
jgi:predicted XRE-type DNA-binding protein